MAQAPARVVTSTFEITSCNSFATPAPASLICGKTGNLGKPHLLVSKPDAVSSYEDCQNACYMLANCVSFGYDPNTPACELYSIPIRNQQYTAIPTATSTFANRNCYSCTDAATFTVHVPEPTQYIPSPFFQQGFGFDGGSVNIGDGPNNIVGYGSVEDDSGAAAYEGYSYFQLTLNPNPIQDDTPGYAQYTVSVEVIPDVSYTFRAAFRPGRDARASSQTLPNCQAQLAAYDQNYNLMTTSGDYQDLPEDWTTFRAYVDVAADNTVVFLALNTQCFNDDYATVSMDGISLYPNTGSKRGVSKKISLK